jgi:hypothetical protein
MVHAGFLGRKAWRGSMIIVSEISGLTLDNFQFTNETECNYATEIALCFSSFLAVYSVYRKYNNDVIFREGIMCIGFILF